MELATLTNQERTRRAQIAQSAKTTILSILPVENSDESSLMLIYEGYYLQISFSMLHPLIVIYFAKAIDRRIVPKDSHGIFGELLWRIHLQCSQRCQCFGLYGKQRRSAYIVRPHKLCWTNV